MKKKERKKSHRSRHYYVYEKIVNLYWTTKTTNYSYERKKNPLTKEKVEIGNKKKKKEE